MNDDQEPRSTQRSGVARRNFIRAAAASAVALPGIAAMGAGRVSAGAPEDPAMVYRTVLPFRCYDSRWTSTIEKGLAPELGRLATGESRELAVWASYSTSGGVGVSDGSPIPASTGIMAVTYNLTVVATLSTGYLMVGPGGSVPTSSHINWFGPGQVLANAGAVQIYPGELGDVQTIEVRAGGPAGSSTHFIVDVTGWFEVPGSSPL